MIKSVCKISVVLLIPIAGLAQSKKPAAAPQLGKSPLKQVIAALTLEEKAKLVVGMGFKIDGISAGMLPPQDPEDEKVVDRVPGAAGRTHGISRLGIPSLSVADGPAGIRINPTRKNDDKTYYATAFPVGTLLASSWDTTLVHNVGVALGNEVHAYGVDILLAPGMNIQRNPLGGRNFEYFSEDPLIAGYMAASYVKGVQSNGVGTSIKHFAANNQEFNRMMLNTYVSERALREIYLKGFEIAVKKSQPWTVMSSYNLLNGPYTSENRDLLTTILRNEWGFKGFVMTDWFGGRDAVAQMKAGNDLLMPGIPSQTAAIIKAVKSGKLSMKQLDANVEKILNVVLKSPSFKNYTYTNTPDLKGHAQVARMAAAESMVLLKNNDNTLPLAPAKNVSIFGNTSYDLIPGGTGSGSVNKKYIINVNQGLVYGGYTANADVTSAYNLYITAGKANQPKNNNLLFTPPPISEMPVGVELLKKASKDDYAIITIGRNAGESADRKEENDFTLTLPEQMMIRNVSDAFHSRGKRVIAVLNIGGPIEIASWRDQVDAILLAWQPGMEGGNAIADVLSGKVNPSGRLATTFPVAYKDVPSAKTFPGELLPNQSANSKGPDFMGKPAQVTYNEGIYVGYRYFNTFKVKPAYEFGYGLNYTRFAYTDFKLSSTTFDKSITASVTVTNTGKTPGKEVVELYLSAPTKRLPKPESELKGFAKTKLLQPGESQSFTFTLTAADLASYFTESSSWIAEAGKYHVKLGTSSLHTILSAGFDLPGDITVEKVHKVLTTTKVTSTLKQ